MLLHPSTLFGMMIIGAVSFGRAVTFTVEAATEPWLRMWPIGAMLHPSKVPRSEPL